MFIPSPHLQEKINEALKLYKELFECIQNNLEMSPYNSFHKLALEQISRALKKVIAFYDDDEFFTYDMEYEMKHLPHPKNVKRQGLDMVFIYRNIVPPKEKSFWVDYKKQGIQKFLE